MTLRNLVNREELDKAAGDSSRRDLVLLSAFGNGQQGLTIERLNHIRSHQGTLYERVKFGAEVLFRSLLELGIDRQAIGAQFTVENLAALAYGDWDNPKDLRESLRVEIRRRHRRELEDLKARVNFRDLSYPELFRETIVVDGIHLYQGNLYQARESWRSFQPSNEDFLLNTKIPIKIETLESILLGVMWADGYVRKTRKSLTLVLQGEQSDLDIIMYQELVIPLLRAVHNYVPFSREHYLYQRTNGNGSCPSIKINSAAICTWLRDDLEYPPEQRTKGDYQPKRVPFKHLSNHQSRNGFFAGLVAGLGDIRDDASLLFEHADREFIQDIAELSRIIGYNPSPVAHRNYMPSHPHPIKRPIWYFTLPPNDVDMMLATDLDTNLTNVGLLFHPKHYRRVALQPTQ